MPLRLHQLLAALLLLVGLIIALTWHYWADAPLWLLLVGGALGVPVGTVLLAHVSVGTFKLTVGALLVVYCGFMLLGRWRPHITWEGRVADGAVGLSGGVLGGLAGLSVLAVTAMAARLEMEEARE